MIILEDKIYSPFFISKQTILQYQNEENDMNLKLSFMDIINTLYKNQRPINNKLYFKVDINEMRKQESNQSIERTSINQSSTIFSNNCIQDNEQAFRYYEIEMKNNNFDTISSGLLNHIVEFEKSKKDVIIVFRDISNIINN